MVETEREGLSCQRYVGCSRECVSIWFPLPPPRIHFFLHSLNVRDVLQEMEKVQLKGEAGEEELKALEMDMTGKMLLASWRGARLEVIQVLREVWLLLM